MADRLKLDTVALRDAGTNLRVVAQEFNDANANSDDVASSVGHPGLASCIEQFAHDGTALRALRVTQANVQRREIPDFVVPG